MDVETVSSFGDEWLKFSHFSDEEIKTAGDQYFDIITKEMVNANSIALDLGCGTGRWSKYISSRVKFIEAIDPSEAVFSAAQLLKNNTNIRITQAGVNNIPFEDNSFDFIFSLGVLHHIPDTKGALIKAVDKLKDKGYILLYLYYSLDNRNLPYKLLFYLSNSLRMLISRSPGFIKRPLCDLLAVLVYLPLVSLARFVKMIFPSKVLYLKLPLAYYCDKSFRIIRNDSLDRFGTPLEQRFSKKQIHEMMTEAGLSEIVFSHNSPFWHVVGRKIQN